MLHHWHRYYYHDIIATQAGSGSSTGQGWGATLHRDWLMFMAAAYIVPALITLAIVYT